MQEVNNNIVNQENNKFKKIANEVSKVIVGQHEAIEFMLLSVLCKGHILLEGVPGIAKTTMIKAIAKAMGLSFKRIQFTPDLLPSDIIGSLVYNEKTQEFETKKGPIFANLILADEINRAPAKVQAALLEAMQENQVTIGSSTYSLDKPFLVFATQNPLEQEGTYPLPEAQVDRFMFKLIITYPSIEEEKLIIKSDHDINSIMSVVTKDEILADQQLVLDVYTDEKIVNYIVNIVFATRKPELFRLSDIKKYISYGVSPRATIAIYNASKAYAFLQNRNFVTPDDVKKVVLPILRHRLLLTYEAEADNITSDNIIKTIVGSIVAP